MYDMHILGKGTAYPSPIDYYGQREDLENNHYVAENDLFAITSQLFVNILYETMLRRLFTINPHDALARAWRVI